MADRTPAFFEKVVLDLMRAMGYGGWGDAVGRLTGKGADEGIDGIIHDVGCAPAQTFVVKKLDSDYFIEE